MLLVGAVLFVAPFAWMVSRVVPADRRDLRLPADCDPERPHARTATASSWQRQRPTLPRWFLNSAFVALSVTFLQLFFNSLAAYAFAKRKFPGRDFIFLLVPRHDDGPRPGAHDPELPGAEAHPVLWWQRPFGNGGHGWLDSYWGLIIPGAVSAFGIFLLRQYMRTIPDELLDAARIDGATEFRIYWQVDPAAHPARARRGRHLHLHVDAGTISSGR